MRNTRLALAFFGALLATVAAGCHHADVTPATSSTTSAQTNTDAHAPGACTSDADCRVASDYCGGCNCRALGAGDELATCGSPVQCFADPCMGKSAACVDGACVVR